MRRIGSLFTEILSRDNLRRAWYKASRGKRNKPDVLIFRWNLDRNLSTLRETLLDPNRNNIGSYHFFTIHEPKERRICAASFQDRVMHHALLNILEPHFESFQIYDSYACRKGKGTDAALRRALYFAKRYKYFAKLDVRHYFDSIDHEVLKNLLTRRFKDKSVLKVLFSIIDTYSTQKGKGVPIGNLTSQYYANHYLACLDHHAKEQLRIHAWIRYMDDIIIFEKNQNELRHKVSEVDQYCTKKLRLTLKPPVYGSTARGVPFLGFLIKPHGIYLTRKKRRRSAARFSEYASRFHTGDWNESELSSHILPVCAHLAIARSRFVRNTLLHRAGLRQEPGASRRQLEQQRVQHPGCQSQQQQSGQLEQ